MRIEISCTEAVWQEISPAADTSSFKRVDHPALFDPTADAFIDLSASQQPLPVAGKPYLLGSVIRTLGDFGNIEGVIRINDWPGFLHHSRWEFAGHMTAHTRDVFKALSKEPVAVTDQPGFVSARIISMIINEAYFALGANISSKTEIDTAMKYGTNYPFGPFEWAEKIGAGRIYALLQRLTEESTRYAPAESLVKEATYAAHP